MPRWRHELRNTWTLPARSRHRITDSSPIPETKKSPGFGIWLSWPTNSQARAKSRSNSSREISSLTKISRLICPAFMSTRPVRDPCLPAVTISSLFGVLVFPAEGPDPWSKWAPAFAGEPKRGANEVPSQLALQEKGQVLGQQDVLVQDDLAARDLPLAVRTAQHILAFADEDVGLGLHPVAVDQKPASDGDLRRLGRRGVDLEQADIGDHVRDAGDRLLGPVHAGQDLLDAPRQGFLAFVEPVDVLTGPGEFALRLADLDVAAHRHPVPHILRDPRDPFLIAPLVEQVRLSVEELLDLLLEEQASDEIVLVIHLSRSDAGAPHPPAARVSPSPRSRGEGWSEGHLPLCRPGALG